MAGRGRGLGNFLASAAVGEDGAHHYRIVSFVVCVERCLYETKFDLDRPVGGLVEMAREENLTGIACEENLQDTPSAATTDVNIYPSRTP